MKTGIAAFFIFGGTALALWGIAVAPEMLNIMWVVMTVAFVLGGCKMGPSR